MKMAPLTLCRSNALSRRVTPAKACACPTSLAGHGGPTSDFFPFPEEKGRELGLCPLPRGEGGPRPALSPAGAGRVRGHSLISAPPEPSSPRWLAALCARTPRDPATPARSESAASLCRDFSNNPLSQHLSAFGWAASAHHHQARSPVDVRSSRNRQPSFRCGIGGEISRPAFGRATDTTPLFQIQFGCAAVRARVTWGCARAKYNSPANGCQGFGRRRLGRRRRSNPSPGPLRLMKTPAAGHPLPKGEGCDSDFGPLCPAQDMGKDQRESGGPFSQAWIPACAG